MFYSLVIFFGFFCSFVDTFENQGRLETSVGNDSISSLDASRRDGGPNDIQRPLRLDIIPPPPVSSVNHRRSSPMVRVHDLYYYYRRPTGISSSSPTKKKTIPTKPRT